MGFAFQPKIGLATVACTQTVYERLMNDAAHNRAVEKIHEIFRQEAALRQAGRAEEAKQLKTKGDTMKRQLPGFCFSADRFEPHEWTDSNGKNHGTDAWRHQEHAIVLSRMQASLCSSVAAISSACWARGRQRLQPPPSLLS